VTQPAAIDEPVIAAIYCRISRDQSGDQLGVRRQEADCRALCQRKGWSVGGVFVDDDRSAYSGRKREAYQAMLDAVERGEVGAVVAYDLDRLHRLPRELETFFEKCDRAGLTRMATVSGDVDLSTNDGRLVARIMGAVAKKSSDDSSRRIKRRNDDRAAEGAPHGARAFGYRSDGVTIDRTEAKLLRQAAKDVLAGVSLNAIARRWNELGVLTPQRSRPWNGTVVKAVLTNPRQAGLRVHRGVVVGKGIWSPILDRQTHERLVEVLASRGRKRTTPPRRTAFTGLLHCGRCGGKLNRDVVRGVVLYRCHKRPGTVNCGGVSMTAPAVEAFIVDSVLAAADHDALASTVRGSSAEAVDPVETELEQIDERLAGLAVAFSDGEIDRRQLAAGTERLKTRQAELRDQLSAELQVQAADSLLVEPGVLRSAWPELGADRQRTILQAVLDRVVITPALRRGPGFDPRRVKLMWRG
jgi:site-specific DNA recombinase